MRLPASGAGLLAAALVTAWALGCSAPPPETAAPAENGTAAETATATGASLVDETAAAELDFVHFNGMTGRLHIVEEMGSGAALFDYDGDGDLDAFLVQGARFAPEIPPAEPLFPSPSPPGHRLFRNLLAESGELRFADVTAGAGLGPPQHGMGVATGDYDGDGRVDLYVTAWGSNRLLRNLGGGRFEDATARAGADDPRWSVPAAFVDVDFDGDLDLYVGNYLALPDELPACTNGAGEPDYCGPSTFQPAPDRLLINAGAGRFVDGTRAAGLAAVAPAPALGVLATDLDGDGRVDLYVANDGEPNHLWVNAAKPGGGGRFEERALLAGVAVDAAGKAEGSMGVDAGDADGDGDLDLVLTHLIVESNTLYLQRRPGQYEDATAGTGLGGSSRPFTAFGTGWLDFDGDGRLDLLVVNGAVNRLPERVAAGDRHPLGQPNQLFRNLGSGDLAVGVPPGRPRFAEVDRGRVPALAPAEVSRGAAFGDVDNDGDLDVLVSQNAGPARLLIDPGPNRGEWVGVRPTHGTPPGDAPGAQVQLLGASGEMLAASRVRVEGSYASAGDPRVLFALGPGAARIGGRSSVRVRVLWPDGVAEEWRRVPAGRYNQLARGTGERAAAAARGAAAEETQR